MTELEELALAVSLMREMQKDRDRKPGSRRRASNVARAETLVDRLLADLLPRVPPMPPVDVPCDDAPF